jgi:TRAP transporter TAXI family solute receptor
VETSIAKTLQILRAFVDGQERWGVRELAVAVGQPRSTVHRLLLRLREGGFVEFDETAQKYQVGFEFFRLGAALYVRHGPREAAMPIMRELAERCRESVWFATYGEKQFHIAYVAEQESQQTLRHRAPIGGTESLVDSACGLVVLAALPSSEAISARMAVSRPIPSDLDVRLEQIRVRGFAIERTGEAEPAVMIAAAVRDARDRPIGSVAIVLPAHRHDSAREAVLGELVRDATRRISYRLGARLLGGASAGSWRDVAALISELLRRDAPHLDITPTLGGGLQNLEDLDRGFGSVALTTANSLVDAVRGRGRFSRPLATLQVLMNLSELHLHVIARPNANLRSLSDLSKLRVSPGEEGFSSAQAFEDLLRASRVSKRLVGGPKGAVIYLNYPEAVRQFEKGEIDVLVWLVGMPNATVQGLAATTPSVLVPIPEPILRRMIDANPGYRAALIDATTYPNWISENHRTVAVFTSLVTTASCSSERAYEIVRTIYENRRELSMMSPLYRRLDASFALGRADAPIHPGALKYFDECASGISVETGRKTRSRSRDRGRC